MDTYKQNFTHLQKKIFSYLCINEGKRINKRQIAKELNVSPTAVSNALQELEVNNHVNLKKQDNLNLYEIELNKSNPLTKSLKKINNLELIFSSGLNEFLKENFPASTIILFGSFEKGEDIFSSDIDIAVINSKQKKIPLEKFEKFLKKEIIINFYPGFKKIDKHLKENLFNGTLLYGRVQL